jgi:pantoate kinase
MVTAPSPRRERAARAFAPGHLTGLFAPAESGPDPRARGSVGAGLVLDAGVHAFARFRPGGPSKVRIRGDAGSAFPISYDVAHRLLAGRPGTLGVELRHELPIGQGFGMSAAGALATSFAVATVLGVPRTRAIEIAHLADLFGGGGLGGVAAILEGGFELRERPGIPPYGRVRHRPLEVPIFVSVVGRPVPSPDLLADPAFLRRVERAAAPGLARLLSRPSLEAFLEASERFTDALRLGSVKLRRVIPELRATGSPVAQAMFGESLFAVPGTEGARTRLIEAFERLKLPALELGTGRTGARADPRSPVRSAKAF